VEQVTFTRNFAAWQKAARIVLRRELRPEHIAWEEMTSTEPGLNLFEESNGAELPLHNRQFLVPKSYIDLARLVALHRDPRRWPLLYRLLWRLTHAESKLLEILVDPDVSRAFEMEKSVRYDIHKMRAFVRFREIEMFGNKWFVAWFEPEHHIVEHNAKFFLDRFTSMRWSILTPDRCVHWDGAKLCFTEGLDRSQAPSNDNVEKLWLTYYKNIFDRARIKVHATEAEMPKKYWKNLPKTAVIPAPLREAPQEVDCMMKQSAAKTTAETDEDWRPAPVPATTSLKGVAEAAKTCTACPLYKRATQTVFGEGPKSAPMMLIGEQPGDYEDVAGKPFVGPAGNIMDRALEEAGIDRKQVYVTNAVKHFKWEPRGKRRIHQKPNSREIAACWPWLEAELRLVKPRLVVCMGATAAQTIFGPSFRVTRERGKILSSQFAPKIVATVHPSSLLRQPDEESREREYAHFVSDLRVALKAASAE
jgi:uracil-DNA glycosylase